MADMSDFMRTDCPYICAELCNMPRAMWAGIAAMSVILPFMEDMHYRVRKRIVKIL